MFYRNNIKITVQQKQHWITVRISFTVPALELNPHHNPKNIHVTRWFCSRKHGWASYTLTKSLLHPIRIWTTQKTIDLNLRKVINNKLQIWCKILNIISQFKPQILLYNHRWQDFLKVSIWATKRKNLQRINDVNVFKFTILSKLIKTFVSKENSVLFINISDFYPVFHTFTYNYTIYQC